MKIEDLVVINKKDLEAKIKEIETEYFKLKKGDYSNADYFDGARTYLKYVYNDISKPLKGFVEDAFEAGRTATYRNGRDGNGEFIMNLNNYLNMKEEAKFENKEDYLKQEIKW